MDGNVFIFPFKRETTKIAVYPQDYVGLQGQSLKQQKSCGLVCSHIMDCGSLLTNLLQSLLLNDFGNLCILIHLLPSFCGAALSSSTPSFSPVQRYPFFFRMLQIRIPSRPITQKTGTKANTAYSAVFSSALRTTVPLTGPPAPLAGPFPTVRTVLTCEAAEKGEEDKREQQSSCVKIMTLKVRNENGLN